MFLFAILAGCAPVSYREDPVPVAGPVWVEMPVIEHANQELDRASITAKVRDAAIAQLREAGFEIASDAAGAGLVLRPTLREFHLGTEAVRILDWSADSNVSDLPWHETAIVIEPRGGRPNQAHREQQVDAGGFSRDRALELRTRPLIDDIAKMVVQVARDYRPR